MDLFGNDGSKLCNLGDDAASPELPIKQEILFSELVKAGFEIITETNETPIETFLALVQRVRDDGRRISEFEHALRVCGHAHFIAYLHNDRVTGKSDINKFCTYFPKIEVNVKPSSEYVPASKTVYKIEPKSIGYALIINNMNFDLKKPRYGSERDFEYLQDLFAGLGYKVMPVPNLTAEQMLNVLGHFSQLEDHHNSDSSIICINTHGLDGHKIEGTDGIYINLERDVLPLFNNINCPALIGKPKIFFIQSCRGDEHDMGIDMVDAKVFVDHQVRRIPSWSDMAIVYSTIPGHVSNRHHCEGSWFVQSLVTVFMNHACEMDFESLLKMVAQQVMQYQTFDQGMQAPEVIFRGWTKALYFNPEIDK